MTKTLQERLAGLAERGIQAHRQNLKEDMCTQFADWREWIREYVTNAYDAGSTRVRVDGSLSEDGAHTIIRVTDNGKGMDAQGVTDFLTVYRSRKAACAGPAVGRHGIGKLCVAAIPGLLRFAMETSTGAECWAFETSSLLEDIPFDVVRRHDVPPAGTRFEITFETKIGLAEELTKLRAVLDRFVPFLPLDIIVDLPTETGEIEQQIVAADWLSSAGKLGMRHVLELREGRFDVTIGIGRPVHELYQSRVLIGQRYDLLAVDDEKVGLPHVTLRVDSAAFELPFGRHCLRNEEVLKPLARAIRRQVLAPFVRQLVALYREGALFGEVGVSPADVRDIVCTVLHHMPGLVPECARLRVFDDIDLALWSLAELELATERAGVLYRIKTAQAGVEYAVFGAPVMLRTQPRGGAAVLERAFDGRIVDLDNKQLVLEAPRGAGRQPGPREKRFEKHLRFHQRAHELADRKGQGKKKRNGSGGGRGAMTRLQQMLGICTEARDARRHADALRWRVSYLVGRDGTTACQSARMLVKDDTVVLNLYHPEVAQLVDLADAAPELAGHFGLAMAVSDPSRAVLSDLSKEARQDLILVDAIAKCTLGVDESQTPEDGGSAPVPPDEWIDFMMRVLDRKT